MKNFLLLTVLYIITVLAALLSECFYKKVPIAEIKSNLMRYILKYTLLYLILIIGSMFYAVFAAAASDVVVVPSAVLSRPDVR